MPHTSSSLRRAPLHFAALLGLLSAASLAPLACAQAITPSGGSESTGTGGAGGTGVGVGGAGGATSTTTSTSSGASCVTAQDCAAFSDACNVGTCVNGSCAKTAANEALACDDGKACTDGDTCQGGLCKGPLKFCPSVDSCHLGLCDTATDTCISVPGNDGASCNDTDACTQNGFCSGGTCLPGAPVDCTFLDGPCSVGFCDSALGCLVKPKNDGAPCDDNLYCTVSDACQAGICTGQPNTCAAPGDICKVGVCNEQQKTCVAVPGNNGVTCNDQNACTTGETCSNGLCQGGVPVAPAGGACDDHDACTTVDVCAANGTCVGGSPIVQCVNGDGCCPAGCTLNDDSDCIPPCCGDNLNPFPPDDNCFQGVKWIVWKYDPGCSYNLTKLQLHTDAGAVALLADNNNFPGATLFQGPLSNPDPQGFLTATVNPPLAIDGAQTYWIAEGVGKCSIATQGDMVPYYGGDTLNGPWMGPFMGHHWLAHAVGQCP